MYQIKRNRQKGYALIIFVLMLMGIGGVVLGGFTQEVRKEVDDERFLHNERVLKEAKRALLQFTYNYPQFNSEGPGRLPCPDTNNNGSPGAGGGLTLAICQSVGRFPWNHPDMNFYDARDASNERLWYAVSDSFYNLGGGPVINSEALGTITIYDQTGVLWYDGSVAGIAAVIIAPGPEIDRNGVLQNRLAGINNPVNYLDLFGVLDNAVFTNSSNVDGFVMGPVDNLAASTIIVNDQIILITTEEVIQMAEKATLQAYRTALQVYDQRIDTDVAAGDNYPWLFNYTVNDLDDYPSDPVFATEQAASLGNQGRVPSIFGEYFTESASVAIESEVELDFALTYPVWPTPVGFDQVIPAVATGTFTFNNAVQHAFSALRTLPQTIAFSDIADVVGQDGRLSVTAITNEIFQVELWFWDEAEFGPPTGIWTICPSGGDTLSDCNRDAVGNPTPGSAGNDGGVEALRVIAEIDFSGTVEFDMDYTNDPVITAASAADNGSHAMIEGVFLGTDIIDAPVTLRYEIDRYYEASFDIQESGTLERDDLTFEDVTFGLRYYPELPDWVFANDWQHSLLMAYASDYLPGGPGGPCTAGTDCLQINNIAGAIDNKISLFVIAGEDDWLDEGADGFFNDIDDVFDTGNDDGDDLFDFRVVNGNDKILVMDEL